MVIKTPILCINLFETLTRMTQIGLNRMPDDLKEALNKISAEMTGNKKNPSSFNSTEISHNICQVFL